MRETGDRAKKSKLTSKNLHSGSKIPTFYARKLGIARKTSKLTSQNVRSGRLFNARKLGIARKTSKLTSENVTTSTTLTREYSKYLAPRNAKIACQVL